MDMSAFNKLPGFTATPAGLERRVLRMLPKALTLGTLLLCLPALLAHVYPWEADAASIMMIDIYTVSAIILHWTVVFTVAIAAFIVMVMKGPAYVADAYPLIDSETPRQRPAGAQSRP
jgi:hypothetical protein